MASGTDETRENLIEDLRARLKVCIVVDRLLDQLQFIPVDTKELIRQRARTDGNIVAADLLIDAVIRKHPDKRPDPAEEEDNDQYVRLIELLSPSLVEMKTQEVYVHCLSKELITREDSEIIRTDIANRGPRSGARELLRCIVRGQHGWFSQFLDILRETEHHELYELTGGSPDSGKQDVNNKKILIKILLRFWSMFYFTVVVFTSFSDLYRGADVLSKELPNSHKPPLTDGAEPAAAAGGPESADISLRDYQMDVARPALEGKNIIVCLPTGSGKTRVAVYITKKHLDSRRAEGMSGKVVVLVNKIPLVEQHYSAEFLPLLKSTYKVERVSGDCQLKISFTEIIKKNDVVICTAQILENSLELSNKGEDEGVNLSDLSLLVIDECHHTQKGDVYNSIMMRYLRKKHTNIRKKKEGKEPVPLPQILSLTASPGVGKATKTKQAEEYILQICANLDASRIMTATPESLKKEQRKLVLKIEDRKEDPFGDVIKNIMNSIHTHAQLTPSCDLGSQNYEQWIVETERKAAMEEDHKVQACAEHLRHYNEGLNLSNTIRMCDALVFLNEFHVEEIRKKTTPNDDGQTIQITETERFLFHLFKENKEELEKLAKNQQYENDSLCNLRHSILREFSTREKARGIIFTKTRRSTIALSQWIQENPKFADIGVKASYIIGGGGQSVVKPMTSVIKSHDVSAMLKKFDKGDINLLVATSVLEEGLDIPDCNFVIRYGLVTNEISMIQAKGRGRADDSSYTVVEVKNSCVTEKEHVNEHRLILMEKAIKNIKALDPKEYDRQVYFQAQALMEEKVKKIKKKQKSMKNEKPSQVMFSCRGCSTQVCTGEDIQVIENAHKVNVTTQFSELYVKRENTSLQERRLDFESIAFIACKTCGRSWGTMMNYRSIECPCLLVKNFVVTLNGKKIPNCTRWADLPVKFPSFDYSEYAMRLAEGSDDEDTE
uniref:RNA helicase n=1 Tax=Cynoglossus semilaevis TaxID=244447 RepID=A0A3P8VP92_CYNSE